MLVARSRPDQVNRADTAHVPIASADIGRAFSYTAGGSSRGNRGAFA
jgi:hypothetical protein